MANVSFQIRDTAVHALLVGEIDHDAAQKLRVEIDTVISARMPARLILDFAQVGFMDSSGIGLILGRKRRMQTHGGVLAIAHAPAQIEKVLKIAQIESMSTEVTT